MDKVRCALSIQGQTPEQGGVELVERWLGRREGIIWVDFRHMEARPERELLERFGIDSLAIDDCMRERHPPKLEWFDDYYFLLLKGFSADTQDADFDVVHISIFVGHDFIVTRHAGESPSINKVWSGLENGSLSVEQGPGHICYRIVRTIIERYTPIVFGVEERLDELEEIMVADPTDEMLAELIRYNSRLKKMRRIFSGQSLILNELRESDSVLIGSKGEHEYNDAYEQMDRLSSLSGLLQELTVELIEGYISLSSHRLNRIMKVLTITAVIFMPLTLLAGIYGMNFEHMPELGFHYAYFIVLGMMLGMTGGLLALFRYLKWI